VISEQSKASGQEPQGPEREAHERLHGAAVVAAAIDSGDWPVDVEILDALAALIQSAARWQMVAELELAA
jgi:hypothetical protein